MSAEFYGISLWFVVAWPLLLAIPALRSHLPWPRYLAIIPAVALLLLPGEATQAFPWLLFGIEFAVDGEIRWILAMSVLIWLTAATVINSSWRTPANDRATTFFLLTLAGNLGAVLTTDLVGFFSFSTLMGYSFYGLLIEGGDAAVRRAGRLYLGFLIIADLALFEALLLAASTTDDLRFEFVRHTMAGAASTQLYLWTVLAGFFLKAGVWPLHLWLSVLFKSEKLPSALLLGGVPIAMGLLGTARWLPVGGGHAFYMIGTGIQILGVVAMLYAALMIFMRRAVKLLPAVVAIAATGLYVAALGTGLAHPTAWLQYGYLTYPYIASLGIVMATLSVAVSQLQYTGQQPSVALQRIDSLKLRARRWVDVIQPWLKNKSLGFQSLWQVLWLKVKKQYQRVIALQRPTGFVASWSFSTTLFVLLGLALAWLAS